MDLKNVFNNLGLSNEHALIYSVLLENGKMRVVDIAKKCSLPRTSCYEYLPKLQELELIEDVEEGKSHFFQTKSPDRLLAKLYHQKNDINFNLSMLEGKFSELMDKYNSNESQFKPLLGSGLSGIKNLIQDFQTNKTVRIIGSNSNLQKKNEELSQMLRKIQKKGKFIDMDNSSIFSPSSKNIFKLLTNDKILVIDLMSMSFQINIEKEFIDIEKAMFDIVYKNQD